MLIPKSYKFSPSLSFDTYPPQPFSEKDQDSWVIVIFQGVEIDKSEYSALATALSQHQFWVIVPNCFPAGRDYLCPENDSLSKILTELENSASETLNQALQRGIILFGHSAGGIAALGTLENGQFPALKAIATYGSNAPLLTKMIHSLPSVLMLSGEKDSVVPKAVSLSAFKKLPTSIKTFMELKGFNHYSLNDSPQPIAAPPEPELADIANQSAIKLIANLLKVFRQKLNCPQENWLDNLEQDMIQFIRYNEPIRDRNPDSL